MGNGFQSHCNPGFPRHGFIQGVDGGVIDAGQGPNGPGKNSGTGRRDEDLDRTLQLMMLGPVKTPQGMRAGRGRKAVRSAFAARKIFHDFRQTKRKLLVRGQERNGISGRKRAGQVVSPEDGKRNLRILLRHQNDRAGPVAALPEDIRQKNGYGMGICQGGFQIRPRFHRLNFSRRKKIQDEGGKTIASLRIFPRQENCGHS